MALTIVKRKAEDVGRGQRIVADVTFDSSYPYGGEVITARQLGFRAGVELINVEGNAGSYLIQFVPDATLRAQGKLKVVGSATRSQDYVSNRCVLAMGTTSKKALKRTNAICKFVAGAPVALAAGELAFTATTHDIAANASKIQEAWFLMAVQGAGTATITKGATADENAAVPPAIPANEAPIGLCKVKVAAGATPFDASTDELDAAHLSASFFDLDEEAYEGTNLSALTVRVIATGR